MIEWDDGTLSLAIGDQLFEVQQEPVNRTQVFAHYTKLMLLKGNVTNKLIVKPSLKSHAYTAITDSAMANGVNVALAVD